MGGGTDGAREPPPTPRRGRRQRELSGREAAELSAVRAQPSSRQAEGRGERCVAAAMGQLCCFPFSRGEEKIRKSHEADLVKEALHRETQALLSRLSQIKELLSTPEVRMKIRKELFEDGHDRNNK
ncbi:uncharacterized protein LOC121110170 [Gallus gallus]|uniref:uncharacterized protein LOC121110170 n=1 Tax=Gallus gallus TaxID=9031 RepID=UPI001F02D068|nr:uncharacterized protein LOC121110170 [Gallus gallus]XP_046795725.1 uncharacterized protein LOC121110170 [Gallus gallus]